MKKKKNGQAGSDPYSSGVEREHKPLEREPVPESFSFILLFGA